RHSERSWYCRPSGVDAACHAVRVRRLGLRTCSRSWRRNRVPPPGGPDRTNSWPLDGFVHGSANLPLPPDADAVLGEDLAMTELKVGVRKLGPKDVVFRIRE